jgi:hypothetical protein
MASPITMAGVDEEEPPPNVVPLRSDEEELVTLEERVMDDLDEQDRAWADAEAREDDDPIPPRQ